MKVHSFDETRLVTEYVEGKEVDIYMGERSWVTNDRVIYLISTVGPVLEVPGCTMRKLGNNKFYYIFNKVMVAL